MQHSCHMIVHTYTAQLASCSFGTRQLRNKLGRVAYIGKQDRWWVWENVANDSILCWRCCSFYSRLSQDKHLLVEKTTCCKFRSRARDSKPGQSLRVYHCTAILNTCFLTNRTGLLKHVYLKQAQSALCKLCYKGLV